MIHIVSIFVSAFLAFQIQPIIARRILPWFGGTPAVWSCVVLFFQVTLTAGYAYSHWLNGRTRLRTQGRVHLALVGVSLLIVGVLSTIWPSAVTPGVALRPASPDFPTLQILWILALAVGLPYFTVATNSPLLQAWFVRAYPGRSPYWLYAVSNVGSLLALVTYPVVVEPLFTLQQQGTLWVSGYVAYVTLTGFAWRQTRLRMPAAAGSVAATTREPRGDAVETGYQVLWIALSAIASLLLLAVTNHITQEVAVIPFLWVLPLLLYLLTFVLTFSGVRVYRRPVFAAVLAVSSGACLYVFMDRSVPIVWQITCFSAALFAACMVAHGELYRLRPQATHLTRFYLMVSVGGAVGGCLVNFLAPVLFDGFWELHLGWAGVWVLLAALTFVRPTTEVPPKWRREHDAVIAGLAVSSLVIAGYGMMANQGTDAYRNRNFYGVLRVNQDRTGQLWRMVHGITVHGAQFRDASRRTVPTTYFWRESGVGQALLKHPKRNRGLRVGVLGLGVGTLAAYAQRGDVYRFYEINPLVVGLAEGKEGYFSYLGDCAGDVRVVPGDARVSLERELSSGELQRFDVLALDVFTSDAIPVHLVTKEAFALYLEHLAPGGIIAANISNRHLDLAPLLDRIAREFDLTAELLAMPAPAGEMAATPSVWVLLSREESSLAFLPVRESAVRLDGRGGRTRLWTDDYSNLFQLLK